MQRSGVGIAAAPENIFDKYGVAYRWVDIDDDEQAEQFVIRTNKGMRSVPTIIFPDGDILVEPSNAAA